MFRSGIDLRGKTHILKVGLLASLALLRCQRSLNSLVKCTTSRLLVNCLWTHQKSTCLHINEAPCTWRGSSSHTYLSPWEPHRFSWKPQNKGASDSWAGCLLAFTLCEVSELTIPYEILHVTLKKREDEKPWSVRNGGAYVLQQSLTFSTWGGISLQDSVILQTTNCTSSICSTTKELLHFTYQNSCPVKQYVEHIFILH